MKTDLLALDETKLISIDRAKRAVADATPEELASINDEVAELLQAVDDADEASDPKYQGGEVYKLDADGGLADEDSGTAASEKDGDDDGDDEKYRRGETYELPSE